MQKWKEVRQHLGKGKRRWWEKFSGFMKLKKKKMEQLKRMDEITGLDESDKNALITNIRES